MDNQATVVEKSCAMAPSKFKREPNLTPPPRKGFSVFYEDTYTPPSKSSSSTKKATPSLIPDANWRGCKHEERIKRVRIKELAAKNAHLSFQKMLTTLGLHLSANASCQPRIDKITEILGRKREFKVLVGFLGATGAGKTTLLNALIGCSDLLPSSAWRASTAVPVEVSYNRSSDPDSLYLAEVIYVTTQEWHQELKSLFDNIQAAASITEGNDDEADFERQNRIDQSFDKLKYVYPHIRSLAKLDTLSVDELLNHPAICNVLGSTKAIARPSKIELSAAIKQYIDSGDHNDNKTAHWPLVKLVKVFVRSSLLEPGIVLVDLPGNRDSNAARSAIAEKYHKDLSVLCIVADVNRGISENNAQELLEKFTKRNLQLDGLYADSLCFVLSKTDQSFNSAQYAKTYPDLGEQLAVDSKKLRTLTGDIAELQLKRNALYQGHNSNKKSATVLSEQIKAVTSRLDAFSRSSIPLIPARKRGVHDTQTASDAAPATAEQIYLRKQLAQLEKQHSELCNRTQNEANSLLSYCRRIESLQRAAFFTRSRVMAQCIQHRNELSTAAVRSDYETTLREMGRQPAKQLPVFPVSATVHSMYQNVNNGNKRQYGFPNREDTRIGDFRDWLMSTTLDDRERYAQAFLDDVDAFLASIQPWITDKYGDTKMPAELREYWEPQLNNMTAELEVNLRNLSISTTNSMAELVEKNIYNKVPEVQNLAGAKARRTAEKWAFGTHWSTHRVVNRERGVWKDSRGKDHKWNDELVHDFTTHLVKPWDLTFFLQFPQEKFAYIDGAKALITAFATASTNKDICPDVADGLDVLKDHINRTSNLLRSQTETAFEGMMKIVKKSHKEAVPTVKKFLEDMYEHCASEGGRDHYARNKKFIKRFMKNEGVHLHEAGTNAIKAELNQLLNNVPAILAVGHNLILQQIRDEIKSFFEQHSADGARNSTRKVLSIAKVRLQEAFLADINVLAQKWISELPIDEIPEDDEKGDEMALNDNLFIDLDKGGDNDYEYDSDEEVDY